MKYIIEIHIFNPSGCCVYLVDAYNQEHAVSQKDALIENVHGGKERGSYGFVKPLPNEALVLLASWLH
ncbi:MAG: hypothetical protein WC824_14310 [Bacteroidota bacterium]|jgi:hypothetical protein